jgi:hypothetical protein
VTYSIKSLGGCNGRQQPSIASARPGDARTVLLLDQTGSGPYDLGVVTGHHSGDCVMRASSMMSVP